MRNVYDSCSFYPLFFQAPELYYQKQYTYTVDLWSLGIMISECITSQRPFSFDTNLQNWLVFLKNILYVRSIVMLLCNCCCCYVDDHISQFSRDSDSFVSKFLEIS